MAHTRLGGRWTKPSEGRRWQRLQPWRSANAAQGLIRRQGRPRSCDTVLRNTVGRDRGQRHGQSHGAVVGMVRAVGHSLCLSVPLATIHYPSVCLSRHYPRAVVGMVRAVGHSLSLSLSVCMSLSPLSSCGGRYGTRCRPLSVCLSVCLATILEY